VLALGGIQVAPEDLFCAFFTRAMGPPQSPQSAGGFFFFLPYDEEV